MAGPRSSTATQSTLPSDRDHMKQILNPDQSPVNLDAALHDPRSPIYKSMMNDIRAGLEIEATVIHLLELYFQKLIEEDRKEREAYVREQLKLYLTQLQKEQQEILEERKARDKPLDENEVDKQKVKELEDLEKEREKLQEQLDKLQSEVTELETEIEKARTTQENASNEIININTQVVNELYGTTTEDPANPGHTTSEPGLLVTLANPFKKEEGQTLITSGTPLSDNVEARKKQRIELRFDGQALRVDEELVKQLKEIDLGATGKKEGEKQTPTDKEFRAESITPARQFEIIARSHELINSEAPFNGAQMRQKAAIGKELLKGFVLTKAAQSQGLIKTPEEALPREINKEKIKADTQGSYAGVFAKVVKENQPFLAPNKSESVTKQEDNAWDTVIQARHDRKEKEQALKVKTTEVTQKVEEIQVKDAAISEKREELGIGAPKLAAKKDENSG